MNHQFRTSMIMAGALMLLGCTETQNPFRNALYGEPMIDDHVWLLSSPSKGAADAEDMAFLPAACNPPSGSPPPDNSDPYATWNGHSDKINLCVTAMVDLIDCRFGHYEDGLQASVAVGNTVLDLSVIGMGAAGGLIGGTTSQILNAASSAVTGAKGKIDSDVLYSKSIMIILQQMHTNRAAQKIVIDGKLHPSKSGTGYQTMYEAADDLYNYARASSWTDALLSLESTTGVQAQNCDIQQKQNQMTYAGHTTTLEQPPQQTPSGQTPQCIPAQSP